MEANRKRQSLSFPGSSSSEINGGPVGSKIRRPESPRKRLRPRSSVFLSHDRVKDLRSHRVFSPSSELSWDMVNQKLGLENGCADSETKQIGKIDSGRGFDNGVVVSERTEVSNGNCQNMDSDSKTKSLIRPCVRGKLYKTPGSVSYKRLLPYLINISDSNPRGREIDQCSKLDKGLEEKKLQATQSSMSYDDASKQDANKHRVSVECQNKIILDCTNESFDCGKSQLISSETVALSPSTNRTVVLEECQNGHIKKSDCYVSSLDSISEDSESHVPISMENSLIVKDDAILDHRDVNKIKGEYEEIVKCSEEDMIEPVVVNRIESQKRTEEKNQKDGDVGHVTDKVDDLNEQSKQMTPPDAEIYVRPDVEGSEADRPDCVLLDRDNLNGNLSNGVNHDIASLVYSTSHDINSKCRGISKPRSQIKLFKCPGSFSYRRMLPFLMDIANDKFDAPASGQLQKSDKDSEQPALPASDNQEIHSDKSVVVLEAKQEDGVQSPTKDPTMDDKNLISAVNDNVFQTPVNAETGEPLCIKEAVSDRHSVLETSTSSLALVESVQVKSRPVSRLSSSNSESKSKDELAITESDSEPKGARLSKSAMGFDIVKPVVGPKRGILKRNPRGCRGLCNCLNCASFRLHAERAFEFSRNQMEDTEELVLDLVNELSYLRNVLEKTADLACHVNQVKEACKKASEVEEVAKNRLSLMNYDLGVHCRITCVERPRIKFAKHVEEHLIPKPNAEEPKQEQSSV